MAQRPENREASQHGPRVTLNERPGRSKRAGEPPRLFAGLPARLTFTADIEPSPLAPGGTRHVAATHRLLDLLDGHGARGTFFCLGEAARDHPSLIRAIAARGHEIASHGLRHLPLAALGPVALRREAGEARARLQDLSGQPVPGFRAPCFSLTPATPWAPEALLAAGHGYSSSVLPARGFLHFHPGAPRHPFAWACGLLELPVPVARLGPLTLPFLGGMYLRYLPAWDLRRMARRLEGTFAWSYCHPYDVDPQEPFPWKGPLPAASRFFLWARRGRTLDRLGALLAGRGSVPFAERLGEAWALAGVAPPDTLPLALGRMPAPGLA